MSRDSRYDILFEPLQIGPVTTKNRFCQGPPAWMFTCRGKYSWSRWAQHLLLTRFMNTCTAAFVLSFIFKHTIGMKVSEEDQATGLDKVYWGIEPDSEKTGV